MEKYRLHPVTRHVIFFLSPIKSEMIMKRFVPFAILLAALFLAPIASFAEETAVGEEPIEAALTPLSFEFDNLGETVVFLVDWTESMALPFEKSTRADYVKAQILKTASKFSKSVKAGVILFNTSDKCKYTGTDRAKMGSAEFLAQFYWWAYKGTMDNGTLNLAAAAFTFDGPYTYIFDPTSVTDGGAGLAAFLSKNKPQGLSAMGAGLFDAMRVKGVKTILMVVDGPPEVLEDGRQWPLPADAADYKEWKESPYRPQGVIPKHGIDGHVRKIAETKIGEIEVFKNVNFSVAYFDMPDWGVKLLDDLAKMNGGTAHKIGE
jgi:hypothetical protein